MPNRQLFNWKTHSNLIYETQSFQKSPPFQRNVSQLNPVHILTFCKIQVNVPSHLCLNLLCGLLHKMLEVWILYILIILCVLHAQHIWPYIQ
jgi:hypothetical protein